MDKDKRKTTQDFESLDPERVYAAIADGVTEALLRVMTNATDMPCHDFYTAIQLGVADGVVRCGINAKVE